MHLQRIFIFLLNIHHKFFLKNHMKADQLPLLLLLLLYFENRNLIQWINEKKLLCLYIKFTFFLYLTEVCDIKFGGNGSILGQHLSAKLQKQKFKYKFALPYKISYILKIKKLILVE